MYLCRNCKVELQELEDGSLICPQCHAKYRVTTQQSQSDSGQNNNRSGNSQEQEIQELRARLAKLEKNQANNNPPRKKLDLGDNKVIVFFKHNWKIILPAVLLLIAFLTLMITLVGIRGIYVNVNNSNDFYDFDATSYRASAESMFGSNELEEGKWKVTGNKLILTVEDDDFGDMSMDFDFSRKGYGTLFIDEVEYKRVSIVGLKTTAQKVKVTFDPQNGDLSTVNKVKIGSRISEAPEIQNESFLGWYSEPDGNGSQFSDSERFWENTTYYAFWKIDFTVDDNGTLTSISAGEGNLPANLVIPNGVKAIGNSIISWADADFIKSITIPASVTYINNGAFNRCREISNLTVASENKKYHSAENCIIETATKTLILGCKNSVIPTDGSVTSIGSYAFEDCSGLTSITIPDSVTSIGDYAFNDCSGLTSITIPDSVTSIGSYAFNGCREISNLTVASENKKYHSAGNCIIETATKTLILGCKNSVIPTDGSVTSIGSDAFEDCSGLTSITIPDSVTSIGGSAFNSCSGLTSITIPDSVTSIGSSAFDGMAWYNNQPDGLVYAGKVAYKYKGTMPENTSIVIKEGTKGIANYAFRGCSGLTSVTIPGSVTSIDSYAFEGCGGLEAVYITDIAKWCGISFDDNPLYYAHNLYLNGELVTDLVIPDGVTSIGDYAFYNCSGLKRDFCYARNYR